MNDNEPTPHEDRFYACNGMLMLRNGDRCPVKVNLYWSNHNPLAYVIGIVDRGQQEAWEVARWLFLAADSTTAAGGFVGGGDFAIAYPSEKTAVLFFKPAHEPREKWVQVLVAAHELRQFVDATFKNANAYDERKVIARQVDRAIEWCLSDAQ